MARNPVRPLPMLAFALPGALSAFVHSPAATVVPTLYSTEFGLSLTLIGTALLISRSADVLIDPLIGWLSDRTGGRLGARKPWIIAGVLLTVASTWFLFVPPPHPSFTYFLIWYTLVYIAWSMIEIPHTAWGYEITRDYDKRSIVFTIRIVAQAVAVLCFMLLPFLPIFPNTAVTGGTIRFVAIAALAFTPFILLGTIFGPSGIGVERTDRYRLRDILSVFRNNRPFWIFVAAFLINGFAAGMFGALTFLYFANYLGLQNQFIILFGVLTVITLVTLPLAPFVIKWLGKRKAWVGSMLLGMVTFPLILLVPKGSAGLVPLLLICIPVGFSNGLTNVASASVAGDMIDYDTWRTGTKRTALYSAVISFIVKFNAVPGGAAALMIVGLVGYDAKLGPANGATAVLGLKIAYVFAPLAFFGLAILFAAMFPIDRRRHGIIARRIAAREARQQLTAARSLPA